MCGSNRFALLWDMDGTLVDTRQEHWLAWRESLAAEGYKLEWETFICSFGQRNDRILRDIFGDDLPNSEVARIGDEKEAMYRKVLRNRGVRLLPGTARLMDGAAARGWSQALASSAPRENLAAILDALDRWDTFSAVVGAEDVSRGKPDPECFAFAAQRLGITPSNCLVFEDAPAGLEAARRAGMACVGVLTTHDHLGQADRIVGSLEELRLIDLEALLREHGTGR
jgi:beta-phosphoglucomutase